MSIPALVSPEWLDGKLGTAGLVIIDLRVAADGGQAGFEAGHVPGAVFSDYAADGWRRKVGNAPGLVPEQDHLARLFGRLGIRPESHVVLVPAGTSANDIAAAARAFWTLNLCGHEAVSLLDGGTKGWMERGFAVETGPHAATPAPDYPIRWNAALRSDAEATLATLKAKRAHLVDARAPSYFRGTEKASEAKRGGHIPGAISADYARLFDAGRNGLKPRAELEALLASVPPGPVVSYCNTGHTAALNWFVLSALLGRPDVALYDGSMTDWTQDDDRPVATGD